MASRFWTYVSNLIPGQTARSEQVSSAFSDVDTALAAVAVELNRCIRFTAGTPTENENQLSQTAAQRANALLGFDSAGGIALSNAGFSWRGNWTAGGVYIVNDIVRAPEAYSYSLYVVTTSHTASDFATDLSAGRMQVMVDLTESRQSLIKHELVTGPAGVVPLTAGKDVMVNVTNGAVSLQLPASPSISDQPINIMHVGGNISSNPITILRNGKLIMGLAENMVVLTTNASFGLAFCNDTFGWRIRGV